jgi:hypothetical protein
MLAVALLLAFLAGQVEAAHHQLEHCHTAGHSSGACTVCAMAQQTALTIVVEVPLVVMMATGETTSPELPTPPSSPCRFPFGPRSPPCVASL